jgi:transposase InsO family protein
VTAYRFMSEHRDEYTVREMAGIFAFSSGAYYRRATQGVSGRWKQADTELADLVRLIQEENHYRYGNPRVREALRRDYGRGVSRKRVARLLRENGLNARRRRKLIPTTNSNHGLAVCENVLNRQFQAERGGEKWVSSYQRYAITYLRTTSGWVYLTVVLDLFDRKVIGWAFSADMEAVHTTIPAMEMAFTNRKARRVCSSIPTGGCSIAQKAFQTGWEHGARRYGRA